ncbi:aldo/keto reductase [Curtobacterium sp. PhB136]|uniref:aldo/keto reductase n=1 Tax=Curtobacterium sp. PhB136 TaxID=2485181 RepID=UPI00104312D6|nr:aldo/keto reductase [Curtobacterium sp. PhB136]TCK66086.1 aryl-alcohol dehydrogenase-like predicted oxidoreductase [Curtobacterium sp. PhB136]
MQRRTLGRTGRQSSVIGLGTWQFGGDWGPVADEDAFAVMDASAESGVTLFDTADVYGDGRSETLIGRWLRANPDADVTVPTKMGRRVDQVPANYVAANFREWVDRSRANLQQDTLDLVQLHCPPTAVIEDDAVYDALDALVDDGSVAAYGVSVETADQALSAIARPGVASVQIILNAFRLKPLDAVLPAAREAGVAILARVPLASGLLSGKYTTDTEFAPQDHRSYNRHGEAFDQGETFSGVPFEDGVRAAQEFAASLPEGVSVPQAALAWVVAQDGVTAAIPGARNAEQARSNAAAGSLGLDTLPGLDATVQDLYDRWFRATVQPRW